MPPPDACGSLTASVPCALIAMARPKSELAGVLEVGGVSVWRSDHVASALVLLRWKTAAEVDTPTTRSATTATSPKYESAAEAGQRVGVPPKGATHWPVMYWLEPIDVHVGDTKGSGPVPATGPVHRGEL